jgi:hypothetical protein
MTTATALRRSTATRATALLFAFVASATVLGTTVAGFSATSNEQLPLVAFERVTVTAEQATQLN